MQQAIKTGSEQDLKLIYEKLKKGLGHDLVDDANVFALIEIAAQYGNQLVEQELREWQSRCGDPRA